MAMESRANRHPHVVLVVSDGTGVTGERVVRAALTQFDPTSVVVERISKARDRARILSAIELASRRRATILFSLVSPEQRHDLLDEARRQHVQTIDLLGPILSRLSEVLKVSPYAEPGIFHQLDEEYFQRTEAIAFAVKHDDGRMVSELHLADLVLVGVSRTTKTPLSMLLAYRGWRVANVPIILALEPPEELLAIDRSRVIGLTALPSWLEAVRRERARRMARGHEIAYAEPAYIRDELNWFRRITEREDWIAIDVTRKAIEETASEIVALMRLEERTSELE